MSNASEQKIDELLSLMRSAVPDPEGMNDAGRIGFVYRYDYDPAETYEKLDVVLYGPSLWTPKQNTTGNAPPDQSQAGQENVRENEFWHIYLPGAPGTDYVKKTDIAAAPTETEPGTPGISMPDGKTITIDETGLLKGAPPGKQLTQEQMNEQIAAGELADGDVVYLKGPAAGENGLLVKVDKELNAESVNPVRNSIITLYINKIRSLEDPVSFEGGAGFHNSIFRGKFLGNSVTEEQWEAVSSGTFKDLYIGDYWIINEITWRIAHFDYWLNKGNIACEAHHASVVPDQILYLHRMNESNTTAGGYAGSEMRKTGLNRAKEMINGCFGENHILNHKEIISSAVSNGKPSSIDWADSQVELMNEPMVYGSYIFSPGNEEGAASARYCSSSSQLALFSLRPDLMCNRTSWWLRDVCSSAQFAMFSNDGVSSIGGASHNQAGTRPIFGIS